MSSNLRRLFFFFFSEIRHLRLAEQKLCFGYHYDLSPLDFFANERQPRN